MKAAAALLVGVVGCGQPEIQLSLRVTSDASSFDIGCTAEVQVFTYGHEYPTDDGNRESRDFHPTAPMSWDDLHSQMRGEFDVPIPTSGLKAVEIYGWDANSGFDNNAADLLFTGYEAYIGQDTVEITVKPIASCKRASVTVRPIDLLKLTLSAGATTAAKCTEAAIADPNAGVGIGTLSIRQVENATYFWGDLEGNSVVSGISTFDGPTTVGADTCLAYDSGVPGFSSTACTSGAPGVCGLGGEVESVIVSSAIYNNSFDAQYNNQYFGAVIIAVWNNVGAVASPVTGAKISLQDPMSGVVVYVEPDSTTAAGVTTLAPIPNGTATGPHGLAILYTNQLQDIAVTSGTSTKGARVGSAGFPTSTLVMMN